MMGFSLNAQQKPEYSPTPAQTVTDLQAAVDYAELVGGVLKGTAADRALLTAGELTVGWLFIESDTGRVYTWRTAGWQLLAAAPGVIVERGSFVTSSAIAMDANTSQAITFTAGRFTAAPMVLAVCSNGRVSIAVNSATTSGATLSLSNWSSGSMAAGQTVWWVAIQ